MTRPPDAAARWLGAALVVACALAVAALRAMDARGARGAISPVEFREVASASGLRFTHQRTTLDHKLDNIMPWMSVLGASVAIGDANGDGCPDAYVTTSIRGGRNRLYLNDCRGRFRDVAQEAGVADLNRDGASMAAVWGDYDNDGCRDLYVIKWGRSELFRNTCAGTFQRVTDRAGVGFRGYANGAAWFDYNRDGCLDLYVLAYFRPQHDLWHLDTTVIMNDDFERARNGGPDALYRNNCDGTFTNVAHDLGLDDPGWGLAVGAADVNGDGWPDLYVANDFGPDRLWINEGGRRFRLVRAVRGISDDTKKGMNVDFGDYDNDGSLDLYVTNVTKRGYLVEGNMLWHNLGHDRWRDDAGAAGVWSCGFSWAGKFFDADNDGWLDLFVVNGFVSAGPEEYWYDIGTLATSPDIVLADAANWPAFGDKSLSGREPSCLLLNNHDGTFREGTGAASITDVYDGRAIGVADVDGDGALDLLVADQGQPLLLYRNGGTPSHHWIAFRLIGRRSNRDGVGASLVVRAGGLVQAREATGGQGGYSSQGDARVHIGLATATRVDEVTIRWPSGAVQVLRDLPADQVVTVEEP